MDAEITRDGYIAKSDYWASAQYKAGIAFVLIRDTTWHLLCPQMAYPVPVKRAFVLPVTKPAWRKSGRWHWRIELKGAAFAYVEPENFIGFKPPLPDPGTDRRNYHLCLYTRGLGEPENTCLYGQLPMTLKRLAPARRY